MFDSIEVNLLPAEYRVHKRRITLQREIFYPALGAALVALVITAATFIYEAQINTLTNEVAALDASIEKNKHVKRELDRLRADRNRIDEKITGLRRINVNRRKWVRILEDLCRYLPDYTWLVHVGEKGGEKSLLSIEGRTLSFPDVATYMARLKRSDFVDHVDLRDIEQTDEARKVFRFRISCLINPNAGLERFESAARTTK